MVYQFRERFRILLPEGRYVLTKGSIQAWIDENKVQDFTLWMEEIMTMSEVINQRIDGEFMREEDKFFFQLLACAVVLIPLNVVLIVCLEYRFLRYVNGMVMES